jgi:hypothetical protein
LQHSSAIFKASLPSVPCLPTNCALQRHFFRRYFVRMLACCGGWFACTPSLIPLGSCNVRHRRYDKPWIQSILHRHVCEALVKIPLGLHAQDSLTVQHFQAVCANMQRTLRRYLPMHRVVSQHVVSDSRTVAIDTSLSCSSPCMCGIHAAVRWCIAAQVLTCAVARNY